MVVMVVIAVTATKKEYITSLDSDSDTPDFLPEAKEKPKIAVRGRSRNADIDRDSLKVRKHFFFYLIMLCNCLLIGSQQFHQRS